MRYKVNNIKEYIDCFPKEIGERLKLIRKLVREIAPLAEESISYGMPAYKLYGKPLVYFAAYKEHIGLYATPSAHLHFAKEISAYKQGKGSIQFPLDKKLPLPLLKKIIKFKANELSLKFKLND